MRAYAWMIAGAAGFALMGATARILGPHCSWPMIALARTLIVFVVAAVATRLSNAEYIVWRPASIWLRSIAGSVSLICSFYALTRLPLADSLTLIHLTPLWLAVLSWAILRDPPSGQDVLALVLGLLGIVLLFQPYLTTGGVAFVVAVLGSVASAFAMVGLHRLRGVSTWAIVTHFSFLSSVLTFGCWTAVSGDVTATEWDPGTLLLLLAVGLFGTVGQFCLTKAYACGHPARVGLVGLTQVAFGVALDILIWGRAFTLSSLVGIALIVTPAVWLIWRQGSRVKLPLATEGVSWTD
jgi:drug/metabolite transporter (DMT)-like permease